MAAAKKSAVVEPVKETVKPQAPAWKFVPLKKTYEGPVRIAYDRGHGERFLPMTHQVKAGATLCGLSTQEPSKGQTHYQLNWSTCDLPVVCKRCRGKMDD